MKSCKKLEWECLLERYQLSYFICFISFTSYFCYMNVCIFTTNNHSVYTKLPLEIVEAKLSLGTFFQCVFLMIILDDLEEFAIAGTDLRIQCIWGFSNMFAMPLRRSVNRKWEIGDCFRCCCRYCTCCIIYIHFICMVSHPLPPLEGAMGAKFWSR